MGHKTGLNLQENQFGLEANWGSVSAHVQLKSALFYAEACFRYGLELHEKEEIAEEIARLRSAINVLTEAKKNSKGAAAQILDAIGKLKANIGNFLRQLETLGAQRAGLEDMLKEMKRKHDILPKLMTSTGSHEDLFKKEIAKYDHICEEIVQNIKAQEKLLMQIQAQNDEFSALFNLEDYKASREKCYKQIKAAIAKF
ncbi:uncharacterized protein DS421_15g507230 [Arachis hypogaea]|nr:uncharacterized protein DS421_15g507230 [Arachis hypogaea]